MNNIKKIIADWQPGMVPQSLNKGEELVSFNTNRSKMKTINKKENFECRSCGNPDPKEICEYCGTIYSVGTFKDCTYIPGPIKIEDTKDIEKKIKVGIIDVSVFCW